MFDSKISINNLGPIEKATINLKNLTVFVGQNNTGKTYLLSCLYFFQSNDFKKILSDIIKNSINEYNCTSKSFQLKEAQNILENIFQKISEIDVLESMNFNANCESQSSFKFSPPKLKKDDIYLVSDFFTDNSNSFVKNLLSILLNDKKGKDFLAMLNIPSSGTIKKEINFTNFTSFLTKIFGLKSSYEIFLKTIIFKFFNLSLEEKIKASYLFPVERAGVNKFFYEAISKLNDTDLALKSIIEFKLKLNNDTLINKFDKSFFYDIARKLETELFKGGKIWNEKISENNFQIVFFNKYDKKFTLDNFSSSINELSIFILYLKYYAKEGDVIFIDEPEISLHPDSQRILVRYLAELSKAGLKFVIITHSDYIVKELNNLICITKLISDNKNILNHYYNEKNALDYSMATVYSIYEDKDKIIVKNADEGEYGFEEKLFTRAINNISQDSSQIFSLLEDSFNDKININLEDLYE